MSRGMRRASIKSPCVADSYHAPNERIAEFTFPDGSGGLLSLTERPDGCHTVNLYRLDPYVTVTVEGREVHRSSKPSSAE